LINQIKFIDKILIIFQHFLVNEFLIILRYIIFQLHRYERFNFMDIVNLTILFYVSIVKSSLIMSSATSFEPIVANDYIRSNTMEHIITQIEKFIIF
jgi:hypothetical protein